jgi:hypothetical protein
MHLGSVLTVIVTAAQPAASREGTSREDTGFQPSTFAQNTGFQPRTLPRLRGRVRAGQLRCYYYCCGGLGCC